MNESYLISMVGQTHTWETSGFLICCSICYFANILNKISFVLFISMWSPFLGLQIIPLSTFAPNDVATVTTSNISDS